MIRLLLVLLVNATAGFACAEDAVVSPTQMRRIASDMLRAEAVATSAVDKADAIVDLCDVYVAIRMHPSYEQSDVLRSEGAQVRRRLITANRKLTDQLERDHISKPVSLSSRVDAVLESESRNRSNATSSYRGLARNIPERIRSTSNWGECADILIAAQLHRRYFCLLMFCSSVFLACSSASASFNFTSSCSTSSRVFGFSDSSSTRS